MAEWMHPINGRKNHLFTRDESFPKYLASPCGLYVNQGLLDPPMDGDPQCARCLKWESAQCNPQEPKP